ncbi:hypothetical protein LOAG_08882 [Loa loa]|uniref:Uncharacterized protein n=1 Tax=Loa loa TaxID=7209 RepID=A0A1S0TTG9_LOALO|nr:hypothetical protein LOAG_08882 [Loa loa]EFO19607.1 hypothetical protein LOAG_08882 [Loa loa]
MARSESSPGNNVARSESSPGNNVARSQSSPGKVFSLNPIYHLITRISQTHSRFVEMLSVIMISVRLKNIAEDNLDRLYWKINMQSNENQVCRILGLILMRK